MAYKTPGVLVEEISTFPPSVVAVETAVPAFVGYTEKAAEANGSTLQFVPKRIKSLLEFETLFGGPFEPASYNVVLDVPGGNIVGAVTPLDGGGNARRYYLYHALRHYFANGGGPCFIVSVGSYPTQPAIGNATSGLLGGLTPIRSMDAPTLLVFPDGVSLGEVDLGALQVAALAQCADLQDRFTIMDLVSGSAPPGIGVDPAQGFRQQVGTSNLRYGAAYYPWVRTIYKPDVHFREFVFRTPGNALIPNGTIDGLADAGSNALVTTLRTADAAVNTVVNAVNVGAWVAPPVSITRRNFGQMQAHYAALIGAIRQLPTPLVVADLIPRFANLVILPRALALGLETIRGTAGLAPEITQTVAALAADTGVQGAVNALVALEKHADVRPIVAAGRTVANVNTDYAALNGTSWIAPNANAAAIAENTDALAGADERETALNAAAAIENHFETLAAAVLSIFDAADFLAAGAETRLFEGHELMKAVKEQVQTIMCLLPASGAVAGAYSAVDRTRGVWKAPANVSLADVVGPTVKVNDQSQGDLNVHTTGKSVNAIRSFTGQGTLIWGARTLAGNDNEWRYVNVRRFFNMAEESIKKASEPFTFEPNDANTWIRVKAMIENFLTVQWRQGALMGATAQKAFFVKVGLGETMTAEDILEGRMIIEIGMAVVRPAEFIILRFAHKMQVS
jgi:phage tail sheath protein FI